MLRIISSFCATSAFRRSTSPLAARVRQQRQQQQQQHDGDLELPCEAEVDGRAVRGRVFAAEEGVWAGGSAWGDLLPLTLPAAHVTCRWRREGGGRGQMCRDKENRIQLLFL